MVSVLVVVVTGLVALAALVLWVAVSRARATAFRDAAFLLERQERGLRRERRPLEAREPLLAVADALRRWSERPAGAVTVHMPGRRRVADPARVVELEMLVRGPLLELIGEVSAQVAPSVAVPADVLLAAAERTATRLAHLVAPRMESLAREVSDVAEAWRMEERDAREMLASLRIATGEQDQALAQLAELEAKAASCCGGACHADAGAPVELGRKAVA
jgi:hypothetical protein